MKTMNETQLVNFLCNVKGCNFATVTYQTEVTGVKKLLAPYGVTGTIYKVAKTEINFNIGYDNAVDGHLKKNGINEKYETEAPNGKHWLVYPKILANADESKRYVRFYLKKNGKSEKQYFLNNAPLDNEIIKVIEDHKATLSKGCQKQADAGLNETEQVKCFDVTLSNIIAINIDGEKIIVSR